MAEHAPHKPRIWLLLDDRAGNRSQCLGVAEALGRPFAAKDIRYTPMAKLPNGILGASFAGITQESRAQLAPPWPGLVIAAGRRTAPVARKIKRLSEGETFLVQIMDPGRTGADVFDVLAVPSHDQSSRRANIVTIIGAPHRITKAKLAAAAQIWQPRLAHLARPWIALIVGGSTRRRRFTEATAEELGRLASAFAGGGSLLVTTSRRTGDAADRLLAALTRPAHVHRWGDAGENPYEGYLALADAVIVTGDSVSMCSEACATAAPVYIYAPDALTVSKHARLHRELYAKGYARPLAGTLDAWTHPPLNAATDVADAIRKQMNL